MRFSTFKSSAALAAALFAASARAGWDDTEGGIDRHLAPGGNGKGNGNGNGNAPSDDDDVDLIIMWKDEVGKNELKNYATNQKVKSLTKNQPFGLIKTKRGNINSLKNNPHIESVVEDFEVQAFPFIRGAEREHRQLAEETPYGIPMVQADDSVFAGAPTPVNPIKICVVDTGYALGHADLPTEGVAGYSPYEQDGEAEYWDTDGSSHGTHCAGTIGAIGNNNIGVTSVNPYPDRFRFHIGKGLRNSGSGSWSGVMEAVDNCVQQGAKIISMSLGGGGYYAPYDSIFTNYYENNDVLVIAAAGNGGNSALSYPASYKDVMSVAAVDSNMNKAGFSQFNAQVEIAGPGVSVKSTVPTNGYGFKSGTSMATPHVAGVAALVWSYFPQCTNENIRAALLLTAKDRGATDCDHQYGYGIVQAKAAYELLKQGGCGAGNISNLLAKQNSCAFPPDGTPPPPPPPPPPSQGAVAETGKIEISSTIDDNVEVSVQFRSTYEDPVVVAFINTYNGGESVAARVKDVTSTGCTIFMHEPDHGAHAPEQVSYIVAEKGRHVLQGGLILEAGSHDTDRVRGKDTSSSYSGDPIQFLQSFQSPPAVLHTLNSHNNNDFMVSVATKVGTSGFEISQEKLEIAYKSTVTVATETIAWVAFETGAGVTNGIPYNIGMVNNGQNNGNDNVAFVIDYSSASYTTLPDVVASVISEYGADGSYARGASLSLTEQGVYTEEDQVNDSERAHISEPFAWAAFKANSDLLPELPTVLGETGRVLLGDTKDYGGEVNLNFRNQYTDPVVVAFINTRNGDESVSVRASQVSSTGCLLFMQEPDRQTHADEWVSYIVMEAGRHTLDGGIVVEAGKTPTTIIHRGGQGFAGNQVTFEQAFSSAPAVLHTLNTYKNNDFMASLVTDVNAANFEVAMEAAETNKNSIGEDVGWIAFASASGKTNGKTFYIGSGSESSNDGRDNSPHPVDLTSVAFSAIPDVVVSVYGEFGTDGSWARGAGTWTSLQQTVYAEEDQIKDTERGHVNEPFAWAAFEPDTDLLVSTSAAFVAASSGSVCGNGICEGDESVLTCADDCTEGTVSPTPGPVDGNVLTCLGYGQPCQTSDECCEHCDGAGLCA